MARPLQAIAMFEFRRSETAVGEERLLQGCEKNRLEDLTDMSHGFDTEPC